MKKFSLILLLLVSTLVQVHLDDNREFISDEELQPIATFPVSKSRVQFMQPVGGQSVAVFFEQKSIEDFPKIYAHNKAAMELSNQDSDIAHTLYYNNPVGNALDIQTFAPIKAIVIYDAFGRKVFENI